jgi:hypothetical protein
MNVIRQMPPLNVYEYCRAICNRNTSCEIKTDGKSVRRATSEEAHIETQKLRRGLDGSGFESRQMQYIFLSLQTSQIALRSTHLLSNVYRGFFLECKLGGT